MKIINKTPLIREDGSISLINRVKGTLRYGFSWYPDLQAQQQAIKILERQLGKKFTLIRNILLGKSQVMIPMILIGPQGIFVLVVTHISGSYRAKGEAWGTIVDGSEFKDASINLIKRTDQFAKAVDIYFKRREFDLPIKAEPILLSVNPALHVTSIRPSIRVVMSDAVERFAVGIRKQPPVMTVEIVHQIAEEIVNPRPKKKPEETQLNAEEVEYNFDEPNKKKPAPKPTPKKARPKKKAKPAKKGGFGNMSQKQLIILGVLGLIMVCILISITIGTVLFV